MVGNALGAGNVGNGVNVAKPKLNKGVGVGPIPTLGKTIGLGTALEELRVESKLIRMEQRKQNPSRITPGKRILPIHPCWL
jgi:hypothetical protein